MAAGKPVLYHVISRVVDRRFVLGTEEKEKFRTLMRMQENFTGCRIRYFTAGAVIGSREFVNEAFSSARSRFGPKRKDGARKLKGTAALAGDPLWSLRDLRKGVA